MVSTTFKITCCGPKTSGSAKMGIQPKECQTLIYCFKRHKRSQAKAKVIESDIYSILICFEQTDTVLSGEDLNDVSLFWLQSRVLLVFIL